MKTPSRSCATVLAIALVAALGGTAVGSSQPLSILPEAQPAIEDAVRAVLGRFPDRRHIPSVGRFAASDPIPLVSEARTFRWTERVLPTDSGGPFRLVDLVTLQRAANAQGQSQYYVVVSDDPFTSDMATLWVGGAVVRPESLTGPVSCCCSWRVQFKREESRWIPVETEMSVSRCY